MKIIDTVVLTLIAGILNFANADGHNSAEQSCSKNGGPNAYANLQSNGTKMLECLASITAYSERGVVDHNQITIMARRCEKLEDDSFKKCTKGVVDAAKMCRDKDGQETVDILFNIAISLSQFYCASTDLFGKAMTSSHSSCAIESFPALQSCFDRVTPEIASIMNFHVLFTSRRTEIPNVLSTLKLCFSSKGCNHILEAQQCAIKVWEGCEDEIYPKLLDKLFKYINNDITKCKDLPRSPKSDASSNGVVNVMILLISVITMSL